MARGDKVQIRELNDDGALVDGKVFIMWMSRSSQNRGFNEEFPAIVTLKSTSGKDVKSCHLAQDVFDFWHKYANSKAENAPEHNDINSVKSKDNAFYCGYQFFDGPRKESRGQITEFFFQARVFVEENPKVEIYWYGYAVAEWPKYRKPKIVRPKGMVGSGKEKIKNPMVPGKDKNNDK